MVRGFRVNKFRGDPALFDDGFRVIAERTGWRAWGVVPWFEEAWRLPAEDILDLAGRPGDEPVKVAVPQLRRIANFDDLDPLSAMPGVSVEIVPPGRALPGDADLVLLPGSKATISDLAHVRAQGWDVDLLAHRRRGGRILGLLRRLPDAGQADRGPGGGRGAAGRRGGARVPRRGDGDGVREAAGARGGGASGLGRAGEGLRNPYGADRGGGHGAAWLSVEGRPEGAESADGRVRGTYLHGLFAADAFRAAWLAELGAEAGLMDWDGTVEATLDGLAAHLERALDLDALLALAA
jgi:adenosylcobyric acid synthase